MDITFLTNLVSYTVFLVMNKYSFLLQLFITYVLESCNYQPPNNFMILIIIMAREYSRNSSELTISITNYLKHYHIIYFFHIYDTIGQVAPEKL